MGYVYGLLFIGFLYLLRNFLAELLYSLMGGRWDMDKCRSFIGGIGNAITCCVIFLFFAILWKIGFWSAVGNALGEFFGALWELVKMVPKILWWLIT